MPVTELADASCPYASPALGSLGLTLIGQPGPQDAQSASASHAPQSERNSLHTNLGEAKRALAAAREAHERHLLEHRAELKSCEAAAAEERTHEVAQLRDAAARWEAVGVAASRCCSAGCQL